MSGCKHTAGLEAAREAIVAVVGDHLRFNVAAYGEAWTGETEDTRFVVADSAERAVAAYREETGLIDPEGRATFEQRMDLLEHEAHVERLQREVNYAQWRKENPDKAKLTSLSKPLATQGDLDAAVAAGRDMEKHDGRAVEALAKIEIALRAVYSEDGIEGTDSDVDEAIGACFLALAEFSVVSRVDGQEQKT